MTTNQTIDALRNAAEAIRRRKPIRFPGWDYGFTGAGQQALNHRIRNAALAIVNTTHFDDGIQVCGEELADLVRYIADMLEE